MQRRGWRPCLETRPSVQRTCLVTAVTIKVTTRSSPGFVILNFVKQPLIICVCVVLQAGHRASTACSPPAPTSPSSNREWRASQEKWPSSPMVWWIPSRWDLPFYGAVLLPHSPLCKKCIQLAVCFCFVSSGSLRFILRNLPRILWRSLCGSDQPLSDVDREDWTTECCERIAWRMHWSFLPSFRDIWQETDSISCHSLADFYYYFHTSETSEAVVFSMIGVLFVIYHWGYFGLKIFKMSSLVFPS